MIPAIPSTLPVHVATPEVHGRPAASFGSALRAQASAQGVSPAPGPAQVALESIARARRSLDGALAAARRGETFTPQELLALQSQAYRYTQTIEVASKVVEQGVQAVKQAVNTQV